MRCFARVMFSSHVVCGGFVDDGGELLFGNLLVSIV